MRVKNRRLRSESLQSIKPPEDHTIRVVLDPQLFAVCKNLPHAKMILEIDLSMMEGAFREQKGRPYFGFHLLVAETSSQMILGTEIMSPDPTLEDMYGQLPLNVLKTFAQLRAIPTEVRVCSPLLAQLLQPLADELGCKVKMVKRLPVVESARHEMAQMMGGRMW